MKKLVIAYSGGLDTSYCAVSLSKEYEVHAVSVNTGGFTKEERNEQGYYDTFKGLSADMNFYDKTQFEKVDDVGNVYNRLVIFNSSNLHAATGYFGDAIENARFFHLFFFDVE